MKSWAISTGIWAGAFCRFQSHGLSAAWVMLCLLSWMVFSGVAYSLLGLKSHWVRGLLSQLAQGGANPSDSLAHTPEETRFVFLVHTHVLPATAILACLLEWFSAILRLSRRNTLYQECWCTFLGTCFLAWSTPCP